MTDKRPTANRDQIPKFLTEANRFGINPGLTRIKRLCELLGHPEKSFRVIHIAGTNGKGSATAFASCMLASSELKVGVYTSPFLERFSERIRVIDGYEGLISYSEDDSYGEIDTDSLYRLSEEVRKACDKVTAEGIEHPTEFELVTAVCFLYFKEQGIDIAVMETGLGGRLDSTNVFDDPIATVITSVGLDHMGVLGDTVADIAHEKAGIFKKGCPAFCPDPHSMILTPEEADAVEKRLKEEADLTGCPLTFISPRTDTVRYTDDHRMRFVSDALGGREIITSLAGDHQCSNCSVAVSAVLEAAAMWPQITADTCMEGIRLTRWKCRAEIMSDDPCVVLDGGHNPQGARSFVDVYGRLDGGKLIDKPVRLVTGVMGDKDISGIVEQYKAGGLKIGEIWPVKVDNPRTALPDDLYNIFNKVYNKEIDRGGSDIPEEAVRLAYARSQTDNMPLVVTGSLYLLGQVRGTLKGIIGCTTT